MAIVNLSPTNGRTRRWLIGAGLVLLAVLAWLTVARWTKWDAEAEGEELGTHHANSLRLIIAEMSYWRRNSDRNGSCG